MGSTGARMLVAAYLAHDWIGDALGLVRELGLR